jgi:hypothetical protein
MEGKPSFAGALQARRHGFWRCNLFRVLQLEASPWLVPP